ncbi:MAG: hypothetical protein CL779_02210 [Chloroflexi bacterium]|nr:hypothetical protein [Chloroflexota bacterium]|tara:strand:- start:638 stop:1423 length:786 start_codon:yes stop_codon:yes gene_type:complete
MSLLKNKNAIITGGSRGIGKSIGIHLAKAGCNLAIIGRTKEEVNNSVDLMKQFDVNVNGYIGDQSDEDFVINTVSQITDTYNSIDILVNNAAVGMRYIKDPEDRYIHNMATDDWKNILDINLNGVFYFTRETLKIMRKQKNGKIIMLSSGLGRRAYQQYGPYSASKFAMEAMTQIVSAENIDLGIYCNSVAPGGLTNSSEKFLGSMESEKLEKILPANICDDIALFLSSDASGTLTGQALTAKDWNQENNISVEDLKNRLN